MTFREKKLFGTVIVQIGQVGLGWVAFERNGGLTHLHFNANQFQPPNWAKKVLILKYLFGFGSRFKVYFNEY